jgi:hypothetical protein
VEQADRLDPLVLSSVLRRDDFLRLSRRIARPRVWLLRWVLLALFVIYGIAQFIVGSPAWGGGFLFGAIVFAGLAWWQPYRLWKAQEKMLTTPGTVTLDDAGVHRVVPGVHDARVPWSSIDAAVDGGSVVGLRLNRYSWLMISLPGDPPAAARVRALIAEHVPAR